MQERELSVYVVTDVEDIWYLTNIDYEIQTYFDVTFEVSQNWYEVVTKKFKGLDKIDIESNVLLEITAKTLTVDWQSNIKLTSLCLD